jgi:tRNA pseudouridine32 synthase/23S rRNA pseudouridine746 synthase
MRPDAAGKPAITDYRVLAYYPDSAWLELLPITGRTHQLRVHLATMGCPILGDTIYGAQGKAVARMWLHARSISLPYHRYQPPIVIEAPIAAPEGPMW